MKMLIGLITLLMGLGVVIVAVGGLADVPLWMAIVGLLFVFLGSFTLKLERQRTVMIEPSVPVDTQPSPPVAPPTQPATPPTPVPNVPPVIPSPPPIPSQPPSPQPTPPQSPPPDQP